MKKLSIIGVEIMPCLDSHYQINPGTVMDWWCLRGAWHGLREPDGCAHQVDSSPRAKAHPFAISRHPLHQLLPSNEMCRKDTNCWRWQNLPLKPYLWKSLLTLCRVPVISVFRPKQLPYLQPPTYDQRRLPAGRQEPPGSDEGEADVGLRMQGRCGEAWATSTHLPHPSSFPEPPLSFRGLSSHPHASLSPLARGITCWDWKNPGFGARLLWTGLWLPLLLMLDMSPCLCVPPGPQV